MIIVGRKPVLEAINSDDQLEQVFIQFGQKGGIIDAIKIAAKKRGIKLSELTYDKFKAVSDNPNSQGVAARIAEQKYYPLEEIIESAKEKKNPLLLILDSIQDTRNLGAIFRTAECAGVDGVIITKHNSAPVNDVAIKTSAGAVTYLKISSVNNLVNTIKILKQEGFWILGSSLEGAKDYTAVDYNIPIALIIGNEEKGIRRLTSENCDILIKIPMVGKIQSLNVSVASGILLFEILKQKKKPV